MNSSKQTLSTTADKSWTNKTILHASAHEGNSGWWLNYHLVVYYYKQKYYTIINGVQLIIT